ncbi:hypothetical protein S58_11680 [Bradyrhizobium oligotrophicum S58]|uniref:Uncharacterized protein n=1 Tax=Bradyrhizobium oligotrophicum S58 TaxID=1245469 RepID=M4Z1Z2_9BRAD|nr:hypothetical protein S58_11680 [Bradyrhizobium oligotrophicum S58]
MVGGANGFSAATGVTGTVVGCAVLDGIGSDCIGLGFRAIAACSALRFLAATLACRTLCFRTGAMAMCAGFGFAAAARICSNVGFFAAAGR